ncbi:MAG: class I SAM-dependent methyltransferase [Gammaproteobacteria bacterium]
MPNEKLIYQSIYAKQKDSWSDQIEMRMTPEIILSGLPKHTMKILDIGCGKGQDLIYYAKHHNNEVTGIDIIRHPNLTSALNPYKNIKIKIGSFLDFQFINQFDLITDNGCFHHFEEDDAQTYLYKLKDTLKIKGFYAVNTFYSGKSQSRYDINNRYFRYYTQDEIKCLFSNIDLDLIKLCKTKITKSNYYYITYIFIKTK